MLKLLIEETKKLNKGLILFNKPWYSFITLNAGLIWITLRTTNPYTKAKLRLSFMKYKMTPMYCERCEVMGKNYANSQFVLGDEYKYYMKQLTWKDKAKALFTPYTIMAEEIW